MGNTNAKRDDNWQPVIMGETDDASRETRPLVVDPVTDRLKVDASITAQSVDLATASIQTNGTQKTQLVYSDGTTEVDVQNPLSSDGDSIYAKDIDLDRSTKVGWTGNIVDLFNCPNDTTGIYNDTITNPKVLYIPFCRTVYLSSIGLGCNLTGKSFSNTKFEFIGSDGTVRSTVDYSSDSTKYGTKLYSFAPTVCVGIKLSFLTANTDVGLSNITIQKEIPVRSRITALKTDGTVVDIGASNNGALNTNLRDEQTNKRSEIDSIGQLKVVQSINLVGTSFGGTTKDTNFWTETVTGTGAVSQAGKISLTTGATPNSSAKYASNRKARKIPGAVNQFRSVCRLTTLPQANNTRRIGAYDSNDGLFFQVNGTTFGIGSRKATVDTIIASGSFNGNAGTTFTMDTTLIRLTIEIAEYSVKFFVNDILLHTLIGATDSLTNNFNLPVTMENINSGGNTTDNGIDVRFACIQRLGDIRSSGRAVYLATNATTILKYGAGTIQSISVLDNAGTISLYDGLSAAGRSLGVIDAIKVVGSINYPAPFDTGLTVVIAGNAKCVVFYE